jgi:hypothetical protein
MPHKKEIHGDSFNGGTAIGASHKSESEESTPGVSASFSCEIYNKTFTSRGELTAYNRQS